MAVKRIILVAGAILISLAAGFLTSSFQLRAQESLIETVIFSGDDGHTISATGPTSFTTAVKEALEQMSDTDYHFAIKYLTDVAWKAVDDARVNVKTGLVTFPFHWDYDSLGRDELADILLREALHSWLYLHDYQYYGEEGKDYNIEQKLQQHIVLN